MADPEDPGSAVSTSVFNFTRVDKSLYGKKAVNEAESLVSELLKAQDIRGGQSNLASLIGIQNHPFDMQAVTRFQLANEHHSTCVHTCVSAMVGLGFMSDAERAARLAMRTMDPVTAPGGQMPGPWSLQELEWKQSEVDDALDPLCVHSFQDVMRDTAEDYKQCGNGYMEVVRALPGARGLGPITGLHHVPSASVHIVIEDALYNRHFAICGPDGSPRRFAAFGDLANFTSRMNRQGPRFTLIDPSAKNTTSEIIHFRRPTSLHRHYGFPDWLSCAAAIELVQCLRQYKYDFFNNRGVPEFFLWILGNSLLPADFEKIKTACANTIGRGNAFKSLVTQIRGNPDQTEIKLDKLEADSKTMDSLDAVNETYNLAIVTAHRVPPLLAGILIPGKLGSNNELPNALRAFQALNIGTEQKVIQQRLRQTLGNGELNGGIPLKPDNFTFRRISDEFDLNAMDTSSRMRQTETQAASQGRDLTAGLKG